jgi:hypothetical protein
MHDHTVCTKRLAKVMQASAPEFWIGRSFIEVLERSSDVLRPESHHATTNANVKPGVDASVVPPVALAMAGPSNV